jgi:hypothetical protein
MRVTLDSMCPMLSCTADVRIELQGEHIKAVVSELKGSVCMLSHIVGRHHKHVRDV